MKSYSEAADFNTWNVVVNGVELPAPAQAPTRQDGQEAIVVNNMEEAQKRAALNTKAKHLMYCALSPSQFNRISSYDTSKEIWHCIMPRD